MPFLNKYRKAITFSFDDGNFDDIRLVSVMNKYGLKSTFNLCSSMLADTTGWQYLPEKEVRHFNYCEYPNLFDGHEVASHTVRHLPLETLSREALHDEIELDRTFLKALYGYDIIGMALPYGSYGEKVTEFLNASDILYCRTTMDTNGFAVPDTLPILNPTCHFRAGNLDELTDSFLSDDSENDLLFYIWGHSYELVTEEDWEDFENFCKKISGKDDIYYCTNKDAFLNHN